MLSCEPCRKKQRRPSQSALRQPLLLMCSSSQDCSRDSHHAPPSCCNYVSSVGVVGQHECRCRHGRISRGVVATEHIWEKADIKVVLVKARGVVHRHQRIWEKEGKFLKVAYSQGIKVKVIRNNLVIVIQRNKRVIIQPRERGVGRDCGSVPRASS